MLLAILLVALVAGAAYLLPKMFESPPDDVQVPDLVGLTEDEARAAIGDAELAVGDRTFETSDSVQRNRVISQDPNPDQFVAPGTEIDFVVSEGKPQVEVPFVVGQKRDAARDALDERGLEAKFQERDSDEPAGQVLETDPAGGAMVREGAVVTVIYSDGPEKIPDVVGMQQAEAEKTLREAGYVPDVVESGDTTKPKGTVIQQSPPSGREAPEGTTVTIVVSSFVDAHRVADGHRVARPRRPRCRRRPRRATLGRSADRLGVVDVEQAVVRRRGDQRLGLDVPADRDVGLLGLGRGRPRGSRRPRSRPAGRPGRRRPR